MENPYVIAGIAIGAFLVFVLLVLLLLSGGNLRRLGLACRCFFRVLQDQAVADKVEPLLVPAAPVEQKPPKPSGAPCGC